ncbi:hypothetical protein KA005_38785 [bacterium]|nr:hypothetical protein [bacterium]
MAKNIQAKKMREVLGQVEERINTIGKLNHEIPKLEQSKGNLEWMLNAEFASPEITHVHPSEDVMQGLEDLGGYLASSRILPPDPYRERVYSTTSSGTSIDYIDHVNHMVETFPDNREVVDWHNITIAKYSDLREKKSTSDIVNRRLAQLNPRLAELHNQAKTEVYSVKAEIKSPIETAGILRELLDQFKGELLNRSAGKGNKYERISNNLVVGLDITKRIVIEQQMIYDDIHHDLSEIVKSRVEVDGDQLVKYIERIEDHIELVTSSIDPDKIGFEFKD